jgi:hypothetical protein
MKTKTCWHPDDKVDWRRWTRNSSLQPYSRLSWLGRQTTRFHPLRVGLRTEKKDMRFWKRKRKRRKRGISTYWRRHISDHWLLCFSRYDILEELWLRVLEKQTRESTINKRRKGNDKRKGKGERRRGEADLDITCPDLIFEILSLWFWRSEEVRIGVTQSERRD